MLAVCSEKYLESNDRILKNASKARELNQTTRT